MSVAVRQPGPVIEAEHMALATLARNSHPLHVTEAKLIKLLTTDQGGFIDAGETAGAA